MQDFEDILRKNSTKILLNICDSSLRKLYKNHSLMWESDSLCAYWAWACIQKHSHGPE